MPETIAGSESSCVLAGYATLRNASDSPLKIIGADSKDFGDVSLHQSVEENGVERMRALDNIELAPRASVAFTDFGPSWM